MFTLCSSPAIPSIRSQRAREVARWFGLHPETRPAVARSRPAFRALLPAPGQLTLITGPSGSGKSSLLRELRRRARDESGARLRWIDLARVRLHPVPVVDCLGDAPLDEALSLLSRVGLAEAWTYLKTPGELSDGQRWRLRVAVGLRQANRAAREAASGRTSQRVIFCADEFAALLDRISAMIVARVLRRSIAGDVSAVVATSHDDLIDALQPDVVVRCDFGSLTACTRGSATGSRTDRGCRTAPPA